MRQESIISRVQPWLLLLPLFAWLLPQRAAAQTYVDKSENYTVSLGGSNVVYFSAPVYDMDGADCWVEKGVLKCTPEGEPEMDVLTWESTADIDNDKTELSTRFSTTASGFFDITKGNTRDDYRLTKDNAAWIYLKRNSDGETFDFSAEWALPYNLLGKKLTFKWDVTRKGNGRARETVSGLKSVTINIPAPSAKLSPFLSTPILDPQNPGKLQVPWFLASDSIVSARYEYKDADGNMITKEIDKVKSGSILLDANVPHRSFRIICSYRQPGDKGSYLIEDQSSSTQNIAIIHAPSGLSARFLGDQKAKVEVTWSVPYLEDEDLAPTDFFEVQRSLTGKEEDFETITQEFFTAKGQNKKATYTVVDSTLVEAVEAHMLTNGGMLDNLTYRVRRTITQEWGWGADNNCAVSTKCVLDNLHLLRITNYSAKWEDQKAYTVRVSWQYGDEHAAVWDDRAKMVMRLIMKNRDGAVIETQEYPVSPAERQQRYKVVNCTRPCVKYDIEMYVERGDSPFDYVNNLVSAPMAIYNAGDWHKFAVKVNEAKNQYDVNAILYADITTSEHIGVTEGAYFRGKLDGNGHTLTFNKSGWTEQYMAPIRYAGNATVTNLHTAGTIQTTDSYAGGLIAYIVNGSSVTIESCRSSMTINTTAFTNGGLVARLGDNATLLIHNSKFDGSFEGAESHHNGGFVGYCQDKSTATIVNCLFAPDHINTDLASCETWARGGDFKLTLTNCHATKEYSHYDSQGRFAIRSQADWDMFVSLVDERYSDVNAIMYTDITTDRMVGAGYAYQGTFDGNGHTLNVNINYDGDYAAPFKQVRKVTIKNLRVTGRVSGDDYAAGLIGYMFYFNTPRIEKVWVSAEVETSNRYVGGFIGSGPISIGHLEIEHCRFDGSLRSGGSATAAAFVSRRAPDDVYLNCLYENGTYISCSDLGYCNADRGMVANGPYCLSAHNWDEVASGYRNITDQNKVVEMMNREYAGSWMLNADGLAVPVMESVPEIHSEEELAQYFTSGWTMDGDRLVPATKSVEEQKSDIFHISSVEEWNQFRDLVVVAKGMVEVNASLDADITVTQSIALDESCAYRGTFNGNGHTLTVNISGGDRRATAPFCYVTGRTTFSNLHVKGTVNGGIHAAGLVGQVNGLNLLTIERVWVSTEVTSTSTHAGGIIGHVGANNVKMTDCRFDGRVNTNNSDNSFAGEIIGWGGEGNWEFHRVYDQGWPSAHWKFYCINTGSGDWNPWGSNDASSLTVTQHVWDNVSQHNMNDQNEVLNLMNAEKPGSWQLVDGRAVPVMTSQTSGGNDIPDFYHASNGKIEPELMTQTRQSSVLLTWNTDGSPIDYFKVLRRVQGEGDDKWQEIATNLDQVSYEDTSVSPLGTYEYKVLAVNDCEGVTFTETQVKVGECKHTGRVEGYVRFNDGTGAPDVQVDIIYDGKTQKSVWTDESGYFEADELSYQGKTSVDYKVVPVTKTSNLDLEVDDYLVTFNATSNNQTVHEFIIKNGRRFSGYVMYEGTSIPVKGVNFLVNGRKMHSANGKFVETDYDGSFSFRVKDGDNTIQAVMDKHDFTNDGWYKSADKQSIKSDVAGIYFYDATKVKLTGRIAGGDEQGKKPLGNNLSKNNLGDSLTMVLTLEGDNTSWLVYDNLNPNKSQREEVVRHQHGGDKHYTTVKTERKRMTVWPDVTTGEYELLLPPVRWKVQQVYCKGYPTLFQEGQVSEVVDLTDCLTPKDTTYVGTFKDLETRTVEDPTASYHAIYNRIYHSPVKVTYKQLGYDTFDYFGDKNYMATELSGTTTEVPLVYGVKKPNWPATRSDSIQAVYTFGHPVFSVERKYNIQLQVAEHYQYNNDPASGAPDVVTLGGGKARMQNGMKAFAIESLMEEPVEIDSLGRVLFTLKADQTTTMLAGENALKTVTFTVERDGTFIEAEPLQGYVLNMYPIGEAKSVLTEGQPLLFDILRDPPGAFSSNTLAKGATLNNTYMMNLTMMAGLNMTYKSGKKLQFLSATVSAPQGAGTAVGPISAGETEEGTVDQLMYNAQGSKAFSHTMAISHNVSTSGDPSMVGANADVYIGTVQNVVVTPMSTIRAVNDSIFKSMVARLGKENIQALSGKKVESEVGKRIDYGTVVEIAQGKDKHGDTLHLIRDVALGYGPKMQSQFFYSQKQILTQIIPDKAKEIADMMFCGTKDEAQQIADNTGRPVYLSLRQPTDSTFAVVNKQIPGHAYNDTIDTAKPGINYMVVRPTNTTAADFSDEVIEKYQVIKAWLEMIAQNEGEKLTARDLVANYDVAGTQGVNYSETFDNNYSTTWMNHFPIATEVDYFNTGSKSLNQLTAGLTLGVSIAASIALSMQEMKLWTSPVADGVYNNGLNSNVYFSGELLQWTVTPVMICSTVGTDANTQAYNRTESFTIATDPASHLNVDVYRVKTPVNENEKFVSVQDIFTNYNYNTLNENMEYYVGKALKAQDIQGSRSFVFRTRGGSTQNPWEDQRVTKVYDPGKVLDARTLKIVNPKIRLDKQSVSGVAIDDAAKFTVFLSNESEKPEATDGLTPLQVFAMDMLNPLGAKISINGQPLTTGGITVTTVPGKETALQMEVRAGQGFDFEKLVIGVMSPTDPDNTVAQTSFDVHFLREAGGVSIAVPGDKWVLNTNAQMDSKRGWYLPVTINGFDRHQHNFDHIEFQYKESQRGDDAWTNLCSFYASDSLMANANGVRKLIPENGNIVTEFYGEGWVMERNYDLRAVLFCRNGSDFLTTASKIITGIKDTRRPQLFGTPEPKSGLMTQGDDIVFNFSEDIEYNYLSAITNFEVKGEVNNNNLSEMVSVQFDGKGSVETEAKRNFTGKDLTIDLMVKPDETGRDMPLFSHGTNGQKLQLWLTKDFKLKAVVNDQTFTSDAAIGKNAFRQVAVTINQKDSLLTFFNGGVEIGHHKLTSLYTGTGTLIFGRANELNRNEILYYEGRMMEARLWYSAMDGGLIGTTYGGHRLTGYEKDLVDYYPMNEGSGDYVIDHTQGANAKLMGASWAIPQGLSLKVDKADKGVLLDKNAMNRSAEHDYTLMFWFKTDAEGRGTLLSNGRGLREDNGAVNQFHIGFEGDTLVYRSNGFAAEVPGNWSDGDWHNFAMTVNRARNVANIYVDKEVRTTFEADSLGGISGGYPLIGASRYDVVNEKDTLLRQDGLTPLGGYVDELMFFAQALPQQLISTYATKSPNGDEAGLLTYLSFDRQERQKDNSIELVPYAYSKKLYLDDQGKPRYQLDPETKKPTTTLVRDYLFVDNENVVLSHFDNKSAAPVVPYEEVTNLKFSFIGRGNQVLVELDEPKAKLNHRNIYVTLRDIEDKNGNTMASPQTACYYVTNSSLQWLVNRLDATIKYGSGEGTELPFYNNGAQSHTYTIENCPRWLKLNKYGDVLAPQSLDYVMATVSKDLSIGTYNEIIYLTDEEGITEPFYLNLTVEGEQPEWADHVNSEFLANSMNISGQVYLYGEPDIDARDIVGVFDSENQCHGFANISHDVQSTETGLYLTVYDNLASGRELNFRLWQYSTGREIVLTTKPTITFAKDAMLGSDSPVRFDGGDAFVQNFHLKEGWNWVSFNLKSDQLSDVNSLLGSMRWSNGDIVTELNSNLAMTYEADQKQWIATDSTSGVSIEPQKSYAIKVKEDRILPIGGIVVTAETDRTINLNKGWNAIGYTPMADLTVETALSDYYDQAEQGDVIKSHTEFAYFTKNGNTGRWRGNLQYMKPGEGYMMLRKGEGKASFVYPFYDMSSSFREEWSTSASRKAAPAMSRTTMTLSATVDGFETEEGDVLVAYAGAEAVGEAVVLSASSDEKEPLYLSISSDTKQGIWFAIERDGEIVAATGEVMTYQDNAVVGSPDEPTAINFVKPDYAEGKWYTINGLQLQKKPTRRGLYIFNGRKVVVK